MRRVINPNIEILEIAVSKLDDLVTRLVFLGGCATGLLMTDEAAPPIRSTHDVCGQWGRVWAMGTELV